MRFKEILARLTGFSLPVFGVSWTPPEPQVAVARRVITFLEDRRVLFVPSEMEVPGHCVHSILDIRRFLTTELQSLPPDAELTSSLRALRGACRKFMDTVGARSEVVRFGASPGHWASWEFNGALGELRGVFGIHVAQIAAAFGFDVEEDLATILPGEDREEGGGWSMSDAGRLSRPWHPAVKAIASPQRLWSRAEALSRPSPVPAEAGIYAWFFREIPPGVPTDYCVSVDGKTLLYVGISPKAPAKSGKPSKQNLRKRIRTHFRGNASGSTLRLALGCLLADQLGIELRQHGNSKRLHFGKGGEARLSEWMETNAFVAWQVQPTPWEVEAAIIGELSLPLNLDQNRSHPFYPALTDLRRRFRERAKR